MVERDRHGRRRYRRRGPTGIRRGHVTSWTSAKGEGVLLVTDTTAACAVTTGELLGDAAALVFSFDLDEVATVEPDWKLAIVRRHVRSLTVELNGASWGAVGFAVAGELDPRTRRPRRSRRGRHRRRMRWSLASARDHVCRLRSLRRSGASGVPSASVTENIYDDRDFFAAYEQLGRSMRGLDGAPEWSSVRALLPELVGRASSISDAASAPSLAGRSVLARRTCYALDGSARMLERAQTSTDAPGVRYELIDLNELVLPPAAFDLAYSALVLHYIADLPRFARAVHDALRPGGRLVLTTEHPVFMASTRSDFVDIEGVRAWPVDHFADEGERTTNWLVPGVRKWFRSTGTIVNTLIEAGFVIHRLIDWTPTAEQVAATPALEEERDRPAFLVIAADCARR